MLYEIYIPMLTVLKFQEIKYLISTLAGRKGTDYLTRKKNKIVKISVLIQVLQSHSLKNYLRHQND